MKNDFEIHYLIHWIIDHSKGELKKEFKFSKILYGVTHQSMIFFGLEVITLRSHWSLTFWPRHVFSTAYFDLWTPYTWAIRVKLWQGYSQASVQPGFTVFCRFQVSNYIAIDDFSLLTWNCQIVITFLDLSNLMQLFD